MKIKTSELIGAQLDWAVMVAQGITDLGQSGGVSLALEFAIMHPDDPALRYSTDWAQGGPIIEREGLTVGRQVHKTEWSAEAFDGTGMSVTFLRFGPTPLIAAMRCYVASKLGDEVEIPKELITT